MNFETSPTTDKLDAALAKVQGEIKPAIKDKENGHFKSSYADIASVWEAARDALTKHGVSVTQWPMESEGNKLQILTRIAHSGEWMRAVFSIPVSKADAHGYGSAVTYSRRFTLMAALGIAPEDEDDDGNAASGMPQGKGNTNASHNRNAPPSGRQNDQSSKPAQNFPDRGTAPSPQNRQTSSPASGASGHGSALQGFAGDREREHISKLMKQFHWTKSGVIAVMTERWGKSAVAELKLPEYQELTTILSTSAPSEDQDQEMFQ